MCRSAVPPCCRPLLAALLLLAGCAASRPDVPDGAPDWLREPADGWNAEAEPYAVWVTTSAPIVGSLADAERHARADGDVAMARLAEGLFDRLDRAWLSAQRGSDGSDALEQRLEDPDRLVGLVNAVVVAEHVAGKYSDGRRLWIRLRLDAGRDLYPLWERSLERTLGFPPAPDAALAEALDDALRVAVADANGR